MISTIISLIIFSLCAACGLYLDYKLGTTEFMLDRYKISVE
ncbi:hypothetical protein K661_03089 [Piscirickettsia salmonis LF-89 = ATCC VR-1361]|nr:hypothetical protein K661_03089 [Piscirickettsia salmonis LF-89 = ATCC VR-1361]